MAEDAFKQWYVQGLQALKSADHQGKEAAADSTKAVANPELKRLLETGTQMAGKHAEQITSLLQKVGQDGAGVPNKIMEGIHAGNRQVVEAAKDQDVRDASVVAAAQIAMHYYIAAYGTLASTAKHLGLDEDVRTLKMLTDETKAQDERFSRFAEQTANRQAAA